MTPTLPRNRQAMAELRQEMTGDAFTAVTDARDTMEMTVMGTESCNRQRRWAIARLHAAAALLEQLEVLDELLAPETPDAAPTGLTTMQSAAVDAWHAAPARAGAIEVILKEAMAYEGKSKGAALDAAATLLHMFAPEVPR